MDTSQLKSPTSSGPLSTAGSGPLAAGKRKTEKLFRPMDWKEATKPQDCTQLFRSEQIAERIAKPPKANHRMDLKKFFQLNCDATLLNTEFEGGHATVWASHLSEYLVHSREWAPHLDPARLDKAKQLLFDLAIDHSKTVFSTAQAETAAGVIRTHIDRLTPGQSYAFHGGYTLDEDAHEMVYLVECTAHSTYNFTVINSGDGIRFHPQTVEGIKKKYDPGLRFKNLNRAHFNPAFLQSLVEINSPMPKEAFSEDTLYLLLLTNLQDVPHETITDIGEFITAQRSGSCAIKAQLALLRILLGEEAYKNLIAYMCKDSVHLALSGVFDDDLKQATLFGQNVRDIARFAARNLLSMATKRLERNKDDREAKEALLSALALLTKIDQLEALAKEEAKKSEAIIAADATVLPAERINPSGNAPFQTNSDFPRLAPLVAYVKPISPRMPLVDALKARKAELVKCPGAYIHQIEMFAEALPIPFYPTSYQPQEILDVMNGLCEILEDYVTVTNKGKIRTAKQRNTAQALFAVIHALCSQKDQALAKCFGIANITDELDRGQLFISQVDLDRHDELIRHTETSQQNRNSSSWTFPYQRFNPNDLPEGTLRHVYFTYFLPNQPQIYATYTNKFDNLGALFNQFFVFNSKASPMSYLTTAFPVLRCIQRAHLAVNSIEREGSTLVYQFYQNETHITIYHSGTQVSPHVTDLSLPDQKRKPFDMQTGYNDRYRSEEPIATFPEIHETVRKELSTTPPTKDTLLALFRDQAIGSRVLRPIHLIDLARRFWGEFTHPPLRACFEHHLLKAPVTSFRKEPISLALVTPPFKYELLKFLREELSSLSLEITDTNVDLAFFLIRIAIHVSFLCPIGESDFQKALTSYADGFLNQLKKTEPPLSADSQAKLFLHIALLQTVFMKNPGTLLPIDLIESLLQFKQNPIVNPPSAREELDFLSMTVCERFYPMLDSLIKGLKGSESELSMRIFGEPCDTCTYEDTRLVLENANGRAMICLMTGSVTSYGKAVKSPFPVQKFFKSADSIELFGSTEQNLTKSTLTPSGFFLVDPKGEYRVTYSGEENENPFLIEKKLPDGTWARHLNRNRLFAAFNTEITKNDIHCDIPLGILAGSEAWETAGGLLYFSDKRSGQFGYCEQIVNSAKVLCAIEGQEPVLKLNDSCLLSIEHPTFVHLELDTEGKQWACFPRFRSLSFYRDPADPDHPDRWVWSQDPAFFLSNKRTLDELSHFPNYLRIESESGQAFALIPDVSFASKKSKLDLHRCAPTLGVDKPPEIPLGDVHHFAIPIDDKGVLCPISPEQEVFCAYIYLGIREYKRALHHIQQIGLVDLVHSSACVQSMQKLTAFALKRVKSPEGIAICLKALILLSKSSSGNAVGTDIYENYLDQLGNIPKEFRLEARQELAIIEDVPPSDRSTQLINRRELLLGSYLPPARLVASCIYRPKHPNLSTPDYFNFHIDTKDDGHGAFIPLTLSAWEKSIETHESSTRPTNSFSSLYNSVKDAKRDPARTRALNSILSIILLLSPKGQQTASVLYHILHDRLPQNGQFNFLPPSGSSVFDWRKTLGTIHHFGWEAPFNLKLSTLKLNPTPLPIDHRRTPYPLALTHPNKPKVADEGFLTLDPSQINPAPYGLELASAKDFILNTPQRHVCFEHEQNHFPDKAFFAPEEEEKFHAPEMASYDRFQKGYVKTLEVRKKQTVSVLRHEDVIRELTSIGTAKKGRDDHLARLEHNILSLANRCSDAALLTEDLLQVGSTKPPLTMTDLLFLFFNGSIAGYKAGNPYLSEDEIRQLYHMCATFFKASVEADQLDRIHSLLEELATIMGPMGFGSSEEALDRNGVVTTHEAHEVVDILHKLRDVAKQKSDYDLQFYPERVVFEYATKKMLRTEPDQEEALLFLMDLVSKRENGTLQAPMGAGKTDVISLYFMARMARRSCSRDMYPVLMSEAFQLQSVSHTLKTGLRRTFNVELVTMNAPYRGMTLEELIVIEKLFEEIKNSQEFLSPKVLLICPEYFPILALEFFLHLVYLKTLEEDKISENDLAKARCLNAILLHINDSLILSDESHVTLKPNNELNFPLGEQQKYDPKKIALIAFLMQVLNNPDISSLLHLSSNEQTKHFSMETYRERVLPRMAVALSKYEELYLADESKRPALLRYLKGEISHEVQAYLDDRRKKVPAEYQEDFDFLLYLEDLEQSGDKELVVAAEMIDTAKDLLQSLIPFVLGNKTVNINCGRAKKSSSPGETVPYICADTPSKNKFGSVELLVVLHFLTAMIHGVEDGQIQELFEKYEADAQKAMAQLKLPYEQTSSVKTCRKLFKIAPHEIKGKFEEVRTLVKADPNLLFEVERFSAEKYAVKFPQRLNATAMTIVSLSGLFYAMSGTPPFGLFHHSLQRNTLPDPTVNPNIIHALMSKQTPITIVDLDPDSPYEDMIRQVTQDREVGGLLDVRSYFKDINNDDVAKYILKHTDPSKVKAVLYFTRQNGSAAADYPALLLRGEEEPKILRDTTAPELEKHGLEKGDYFPFYDRRHTEGTDIPALPHACYALLPGSQDKTSEETQGIARLRAFLKGQRTKVFIDSDEAALYNPNFATQPVGEQYRTIVKRSLRNEARTESVEKLTSFRKMFSNAVVSQLRSHLVRMPTATKEDILAQVDLLDAVKMFIVVDDTEKKQECRLEKDFDVLVVLQAEAKSLLDSLRANGAVPPSVLQKVEAEITEILKLAEETKGEFVQTVRKSVHLLTNSKAAPDTEVQAQIQEDQEHEMDVDVGLQRQVEQELQDLHGPAYLTDSSILPFSPDAFIRDQWTNFAQPQGSMPVSQAFTAKYCPPSKMFKTDYGLIFLNNLQVTPEYLQPYKETVPIISRRMPPVQYLVVFHDEKSSSYKGVITTRFQAEHLTAYIRSTNSRNVWVILPNLEIEAGRSSIDFEEQALQQILIPFNILAGNLSYPFEQLMSYVNWLDMDPAVASIKKRFLYLMYTKYEPLFDKGHLMLSDRNEIDRFLYKESDSKLLEEAQSLDPAAIRSDPDRFKKYFPYLRGEELVQVVPISSLDQLRPEQMPFISREQAAKITNIRCIQKIPGKVIAQLTAAELEPRLRAMTTTQMASISDVDILPLVEKNRWKQLLPARLFENANISAIDFGFLSDAQFAALSPTLASVTVSAHHERARRINDPDLILQLVEKGRLRLNDVSRDNLQNLRSPRFILYVEDFSFDALHEELLVEGLKLPKADLAGPLQVLRNPPNLHRLWDLGYREFTRDQLSRITQAGIFVEFDGEQAKAIITDEGKAHHLNWRSFLTKEYFEGYKGRIASSLLILLDAERIGWYLDSYPAGVQQLLQVPVRVLIQVQSKTPFTITQNRLDELNPADFDALSDELLNNLSSRQIVRISKPEQVRRLTTKQIIYINPAFADEIENPTIELHIEQFPRQLLARFLLGKIETFDDNLLRKFITKCGFLGWTTPIQSVKSTLEQATNEDFLRRLEALRYSHFTQDQRYILNPKLNPAYYTHDVLISHGKHIESSIVKAFTADQWGWYLDGYPAGVRSCEDLTTEFVLQIRAKTKTHIPLTAHQVNNTESDEALLQLEDNELRHLYSTRCERINNFVLFRRILSLADSGALYVTTLNRISSALVDQLPSESLTEPVIKGLLKQLSSEERLRSLNDEQLKIYFNEIRDSHDYSAMYRLREEKLDPITDLALLQRFENAGYSRLTDQQKALLAAERERLRTPPPPPREKTPPPPLDVPDIAKDDGESSEDLTRTTPPPTNLPPPDSPKDDEQDDPESRRSPVAPPIFVDNGPPYYGGYGSGLSGYGGGVQGPFGDDRPYYGGFGAGDRPGPVVFDDQENAPGPFDAEMGHDYHARRNFPNARPSYGNDFHTNNPPPRPPSPLDDEQDEPLALKIERMTVRELKAFMKKDKNHRKLFRGVTNPKTLSRLLQAGFMSLTAAQVKKLEQEKDFLLLPEQLLPHLTPKQVYKIKDPKLLAKLGPDLVSHINPKNVEHVTPAAISGIKDEKVVALLSTKQLRYLAPEQLKLSTWTQSVTYTVMAFAEALFSLVVFPVVEIAYWLTRFIVSISLLKESHEYVTGSLSKAASLNTYLAQRVLCCA